MLLFIRKRGGVPEIDYVLNVFDIFHYRNLSILISFLFFFLVYFLFLIPYIYQRVNMFLDILFYVLTNLIYIFPFIWDYFIYYIEINFFLLNILSQIHSMTWYMYQKPITSKGEKSSITVTCFMTFASFVILLFKLLDNIVTCIECELENRERLSDLTLLLNSQST